MKNLFRLRNAKSSTMLLTLVCLVSGAGVQLQAQELASSSVAGDANAALPDSPSSLAGLQAEQSDNGPKMQWVPPPSHSRNYRPFDGRAKSYLYDMFGPGAFIGAGIQAGVEQGHSLKVPYPSDGFVGAGNHPAHGTVPEWGEGFDGYAKRYASAYGQSLAGTTIRYGLGELLRQDVTYHRCDCMGVLPRISHAFVSSFVAHTESGRAVPSLPALVSPFLASEVAVKAWYPDRYNTSDALRTSTTVYYTLPLKNLFNEFGRR